MFCHHPGLFYTAPHPGLFYTIELALISEIDPASVSTTTSREPSDTPSTYCNTCHLCEKLFCQAKLYFIHSITLQQRVLATISLTPMYIFVSLVILYVVFVSQQTCKCIYSAHPIMRHYFRCCFEVDGVTITRFSTQLPHDECGYHTIVGEY